MDQPSDNLYVTGLPEDFYTDAIHQFFSACGTVVSAKALGYGNAMVRFASPDEAAVVKDSMNGQQPIGCPKPLTITFAVDRYSEKGEKGAWGGCKGDKGDKGGKGKGKMAKGGDWNCPACGDLQFERNTMCRLCGCPKDGWGSLTGGGGDFGKGDFGKGGKGFGGDAMGPYGAKGMGKGPGKMAGKSTSAIDAVIDGLVREGLPGGWFNKDENALYVSNLPHDTTDKDLYVIFATFGAMPPRGVRVMPGTPGQRLWAFVNFMDSTTKEFAMMALNGVTQPDGCKLIVTEKKTRETLAAEKTAKAAGKGKGMLAIGGGDDGGLDSIMMSRLREKLSQGTMNAYELSQWYIIEYLGHVTDENEMKTTCDQLLAASAKLGLA
jgi:hypothetical protein